MTGTECYPFSQYSCQGHEHRGMENASLHLIFLSTAHSLGRSREQLATFIKTLPHACSPHLPGIETVAGLTH